MNFNPDTETSNTETTARKIEHTKVSHILRFSAKQRLNIVMQAEASECGLACVAMLANFHGNHISLDKLRQLNPVSIQGSNLTQLMQLGDLLGLSCRALKVQLAELKELNTPCILHWNFQHFVVLQKVSK
ncbi:MAG: ATP-binding cassette subfamily B protein RaxB, partial [Glaciecola sp.]